MHLNNLLIYGYTKISPALIKSHIEAVLNLLNPLNLHNHSTKQKKGNN